MIINKIKQYFNRRKELKVINKIIIASWDYSCQYNLKKEDTIKQIDELLKITGGIK